MILQRALYCEWSFKHFSFCVLVLGCIGLMKTLNQLVVGIRFRKTLNPIHKTQFPTKVSSSEIHQSVCVTKAWLAQEANFVQKLQKLCWNALLIRLHSAEFVQM